MNKYISELISRIPKDMNDFIADGLDDAYTEKDVAKCIVILRDYLQEIKTAQSQDQAMETVKVAVLKLNDLNDACQGALIETGQREDIAELLQAAFVEKGFTVPPSGDITEDYRDW
ncbi:hypothetical protein [Neolewinella antarctica]|uniref:Uncharacterized protein n=1 Tax=Neolewinella antarctica TaxID=442734 RepID=A0ABX0XCS8_9BACT|nr:hypothetical protein [Neolewinella antarctica]NJC27083.1 hypothetical protein [Neolewinella antarctica]